jgi:ABC-type uncharacterized transport system permease subunit
MRIVTRYTAPVLTVTGGLCLGEAIRSATHHGHAWPWLAAIAALMWAGTAAALWLPYLTVRRRLLAERRDLLAKRALLLDMMRNLDDMAASGLLAPEGER